MLKVETDRNRLTSHLCCRNMFYGDTNYEHIDIVNLCPCHGFSFDVAWQKVVIRLGQLFSISSAAEEYKQPKHLKKVLWALRTSQALTRPAYFPQLQKGTPGNLRWILYKQGNQGSPLLRRSSWLSLAEKGKTIKGGTRGDVHLAQWSGSAVLTHWGAADLLHSVMSISSLKKENSSKDQSPALSAGSVWTRTIW